MSNVWGWFVAGGLVMYPLLLCSMAIWVVIFERLYRYRSLSRAMKAFHLEAMNCLLRGDRHSLDTLCSKHPFLPTARLVMTALERLDSNDLGLKERWREALERRRQLENLELKRNLWVLGTVASSAPFIGLFGTVVGILQSFSDIAESGKGGFAIVASGISEALIATATGIVVAVIAVMAFNAFQTYWVHLVLTLRIQVEEFAEALSTRKFTGGA